MRADASVSRLLTLEPGAAALSTDAKAAMVEAMEPQLRDTVAQLKEVKSLSEEAVNPASLAGATRARSRGHRHTSNTLALTRACATLTMVVLFGTVVGAAGVPAQAARLDKVELTTAQQAAAAAVMRDSVNKMLASYDSIVRAPLRQ